jgi:hypothetical protein
VGLAGINRRNKMGSASFYRQGFLMEKNKVKREKLKIAAALSRGFFGTLVDLRFEIDLDAQNFFENISGIGRRERNLEGKYWLASNIEKSYVNCDISLNTTYFLHKYILFVRSCLKTNGGMF